MSRLLSPRHSSEVCSVCLARILSLVILVEVLCSTISVSSCHDDWHTIVNNVAKPGHSHEYMNHAISSRMLVFEEDQALKMYHKDEPSPLEVMMT